LGLIKITAKTPQIEAFLLFKMNGALLIAVGEAIPP
jgi:hypothetical protein